MNFCSKIHIFSFVSFAFACNSALGINDKNVLEETVLRTIACDTIHLCRNRLPLPGAISAPQVGDGLDAIVVQLIGSGDENVLRGLSDQNIEQLTNNLPYRQLLTAKQSFSNVAIENLAVYEFDKFLDLKHCPSQPYSQFVNILVPILSDTNGEPMSCYRGICRALMANKTSWTSWATSVVNCDYMVIGDGLKKAVGSLPRQIKNKLLAVIAPKGFEGPEGAIATNRVLEALKYRLALDKKDSAKK